MFLHRLRLNDLWRDIETEWVERDYAAEKRLAAREFEEKKKELKENLLIELEEKKKIIEQERYTLELTGDSMEVGGSNVRDNRCFFLALNVCSLSFVFLIRSMFFTFLCHSSLLGY